MTFLLAQEDTQEFNGDVALGLVIIGIFLLIVYAPIVVAFMKGQILWGVLGIVVFAPLGWAGALMTAKPTSWWARNRYDDAQMAEAIAKHGDPTVAVAAQPPVAPGGTAPAASGLEVDDGDWVCGICGETAATKVAAESHVRGAHPQAPVESSIQQAMG